MINEQEIKEFKEQLIRYFKQEIWTYWGDREWGLKTPTQFIQSPFQSFTPGHGWSEVIFWDGDEASRLDKFVNEVFEECRRMGNCVYLFCLEEAFTDLAEELPQPGANQINLSACFYAFMTKTLLLADKVHSLEMKDWAIAMEGNYGIEARLEG